MYPDPIDAPRRNGIMPRMANIPVEQSSSPARERHPPPWAARAAPGGLALLLFLALALGRGVLGEFATPLQSVLALALVASIVLQPKARDWFGALLATANLAHVAAVAAVVAVAVGLRFWGLRFGLPYLEHPDEWAVADDALRMLRTGDYSPFSYTYPTLYVYLQVGVAAAHFLWGAGAGLYRTPADIDPAHYYVWARALTAFLGSGAVILTYLIGRMLYQPATGLIAATILAVMPAVAGDAHYVTTDTPAMFFTLLAFLMIARLGLGGQSPGQLADQEAERTIDRPIGAAERRANYVLALLAGLGVGMAAATKWNAGALVIALGTAVIFAARRMQSSDVPRDREPASAGVLQLPTLNLRSIIFLAVCAGLGVLTGFTLGVPLWLRELPRILADLAGIVIHYRIEGHPGAESSRPALFYWWALTREGMLLAWVCLGGIALAFVRRRPADLLILAVVIPAVLQLTGVRVVFFRNTMPLLPFLCMLGAALTVVIGERVAGIMAGMRRAGERETQKPGDRETGRGTARSATDLPFLASPRTRQARIAILTLLTILIAVEPFAQAFHDELLRSRPTTRVLAGAWLDTQTADGDRVWLENNTLILPQRLRALGGTPAIQNSMAWYQEQGIRFVVVDIGRDSGQAALATFGEPAARFVRNNERHGPDLAIFASGVAEAGQEPRTLSGATLGAGAIILDGYRHPAVVRPGATLPLALFWRATRPLPADYVVYIHLVDAAGNKVAQRDLAPLEGRRPTSNWPVDEVIRDDQDLSIPATVTPGSYRLLAGMYDGTTLAAINDTGPIDLGEVRVGD